MIKVTLLGIWAVLTLILLIAIFSFTIFKIAQMIRKPPPPKAIVIPNIPIGEMERIIQDKNSPMEKLISVIRALVAHHPIPPKKDGKPTKEGKRYLDLIFTMAGHKSMTPQLQDEMYDVLTEANPTYLREFNRARRAG